MNPTSRRELRALERTAEASQSRRDRRIAKAIAGVTTSAAASAAAVRPSHPQRTLGARMMSVGAMLFTAALLVGLSVPANAFLAPTQNSAVAESAGTPLSGAAAAQSLATGSAGAVVASRDGYKVTAPKPEPVAPAAAAAPLSLAATSYPRIASTGTVRWPFPGPVPISDGFGPRISPCSGCSSMHQGADFLPGEGAPIYAIADGVVTTHEDGSGGFGHYVIITHQIGGQSVASTYAHMQHGSSPLTTGQKVRIGDFIGTVGRTGATTGPHLHLEIAVAGTPIDPVAWLTANAG